MRRNLSHLALYNSQDASEHQLRQRIQEHETGIHTYPGDWTNHAKAWDMAARNAERLDPDNVLGLILFKIIDYDNQYGPESEPCKKLSALFDEYFHLPYKSKIAPRVNEDFRKRLNTILQENPLKICKA